MNPADWSSPFRTPPSHTRTESELSRTQSNAASYCLVDLRDELRKISCHNGKLSRNKNKLEFFNIAMGIVAQSQSSTKNVVTSTKNRKMSFIAYTICRDIPLTLARACIIFVVCTAFTTLWRHDLPWMLQWNSWFCPHPNYYQKTLLISQSLVYLCYPYLHDQATYGII